MRVDPFAFRTERGRKLADVWFVFVFGFARFKRKVDMWRFLACAVFNDIPDSTCPMLVADVCS